MFAQLDFPESPVVILKLSENQKQFMNSNLPSLPGYCSELDLKLIPGDLGDKDESTETGKKINKILNSNRKSLPILLYAVRGAGKTKAFFDLLRQR